MEINQVESSEFTGVLGEVSKMGHEQVVFCNDNETGLKAIIGIHNTVLGPSLGGTRMWNYQDENEAIIDVLRLSRGMTYKSAVSGLNIGGGKAVLIGDARTMKTEAYLRRFGKFVESLGGKYVTAEDVNMNTHDMEFIKMETNHVTGLPIERGGSGDPSPVTAYGTYVGMKALAKKVFGKDSLSGKKILVQGVGQVGTYLTEHLRKEDATVFITDIDDEKVKNVAAKTGAVGVEYDKIYDMDIDIYSPCALGATLNDQTISKLKCSIIAGAANNQLKDEIKHGYDLMDKQIIYAPDFVINAGGVMSVYLEHLGEYSESRIYNMAETIYENCKNVIEEAEQSNCTPQEAAMKIAEKRINQVGKVKLSY